MTQSPRYRTPGLGGKSLAMILAGMLTALAVPLMRRREPFMLAWDAILLNVWLVGIVLGLAMGLNWLATTLANRVNRAFVRIAAVAFCTYLQTLWGVTDGWKYAIDMTGMLLIQSVYFRIVGVPDWVLYGANVTDTSPKRSQFRIFDLIAWTTGLAILLALSIRFDAPIDPVRYWSVLCIGWLVVPMVATCWTLAGLLPGLSRAQWLWLATGCLLTLLLTAGLESAEGRAMNRLDIRVNILALYGVMFGGHALTMLLFSVAGRCQGTASPPLPREPQVETPAS